MASGRQAAVNGSAEIAIGIARMLMGACFVVFGLTKLLAIDGTIGFIGHYMPLPVVVFWLAILIEVGLGLCVLIGFATRYAAGFFAVYVIFIAIVFHGMPGDRVQRDQALKNLVMAGGFITIAAVGSGAWSIDRARRKDA